MVTDDSRSLVFPIGQSFGTFFDPLEGESFKQVRVGPDVVRLESEQFVVWSLCHGAADRQPGEPWDRAEVLAIADHIGISDAGVVLENLVADHMVAETTPGTDSAVEFARRHRMVPAMLGLGNSAEEPRLYAVGLPGRPVVEMTSLVYHLYEWAHLDPDLWTACNGAAATARQVQVANLTATDPARLLEGLLSTLHTLLSPHSVYLDARLA